MHALVVDDDIGSSMVVQKMLMSFNITCDIASSAADGVASARSNSYDLVLLDAFMPDSNAWEIAEEFKSSGSLRRTKLCGMLSCPDQEYEKRCQDAGMELVLVKPITKTSLFECISKTLQRNTSQGMTEFKDFRRDDALMSHLLLSNPLGVSSWNVGAKDLKDLGFRNFNSSSTISLESSMPAAGPLALGELNCIQRSSRLQSIQ
mmetsp:Transcript_7600/g.22997  ORF Transcript_7600/g.22997 Transcript_7600/m.22997 type:complete len:205 (-) Transcript_7600:38-652(-)